MSLFAMQLANAFSSRELSNSQSLLKNSIHKLSSGKRLVKSRDDAGMLSVQIKMNADNSRNASAMGKISNAVSFLDMQDSMLNNAQNILTRMSELKGLSTNDPMKSEQDIDSYNNEFHDRQEQLYQLSIQTFNGTSLFATTTEKLGGEEVRFKGVNNERNIITLTTESSTISIQKLAFIDSLKVINYDPAAVENHTVKLSPTVGFEMIRVEPGTFIMGSPVTETGRRSNEGQYNVTISKEFYLGKYEVTQEQMHDVMSGNENGISSNPTRWDRNPNRPVEDISWNDFQTSYFNQAIENIPYLRAEASATKSRLEFTGDSIQNLRALSSTAIGRISDVDCVMENSKLAKQKFLSSSSAAMIAQANSMNDVLPTMLN